MLNALDAHAQGTAGVYGSACPTARRTRPRSATAARIVATQALSGTRLPAPVDVEAVVRGLGRDDRLTRAYAEHLLRRSTSTVPWRCSGCRRPARRGPAQNTRSRATVKRFSLRAGRRRATLGITFSQAALRRLRRDAGSRRRPGARARRVRREPMPVVRFVDLALRIRR